MTSHVNVLQELPVELRPVEPWVPLRDQLDDVLHHLREHEPRPCAGGCGRTTPALWQRCVRCEVEERARRNRPPMWRRAITATALFAAYLLVGAVAMGAAFLITVYWLAGSSL